MSNQNTRIDKLETLLKRSMEIAVSQGWTIRRNLTIKDDVKQCCAIGSLKAIDEHCTFDLINDEKFNLIADGFDGAKWHKENEYYQLGARLWDYAVSKGWTN